MKPTSERQEFSFSPVPPLVRSIPTDFTVTLLNFTDPGDKFQLCRHQARVAVSWSALQQLQLSETVDDLTNQLKTQKATLDKILGKISSHLHA